MRKDVGIFDDFVYFMSFFVIGFSIGVIIFA